MPHSITKQECMSIARFIDNLENACNLKHVPNAIARKAFHYTNIYCDKHLRLCVYVSPKKSKSQIARFDIHPSKRQCCNTCREHANKNNIRIFCEGGDLCNQPLKTLELVLQSCQLPTYVPINIIPYPFEKEHTSMHLNSDSIWNDEALQEDAHANGLYIDEEKAYVIDCNKNMRHRRPLNKLFSDVLKPFFNERGKQFECHNKDFLRFAHHDLCRYAIPYMILTSSQKRRKSDFMKWSKEVAIRVCADYR